MLVSEVILSKHPINFVLV